MFIREVNTQNILFELNNRLWIRQLQIFWRKKILLWPKFVQLIQGKELRSKVIMQRIFYFYLSQHVPLLLPHLFLLDNIYCLIWETNETGDLLWLWFNYSLENDWRMNNMINIRLNIKILCYYVEKNAFQFPFGERRPERWPWSIDIYIAKNQCHIYGCQKSQSYLLYKYF